MSIRRAISGNRVLLRLRFCRKLGTCRRRFLALLVQVGTADQKTQHQQVNDGCDIFHFSVFVSIGAIHFGIGCG